MGVLTIRNVDDEVVVALKARAKANHRSLEGELRYLLGRYAIPRPALGLVRERARLAAAHKATATARRAPADTASQPGDEAFAEAGAEAAHDDAHNCPDDRDAAAEWMGAMSDVGEIVGDIVSPAAEPSDWDALRPRQAPPRDVDGP